MQNNTSFETKLGTKVEFKPYLTGREMESLQDITADTVEKKNLLISHKTIELLVVSINGNSQEILKNFLDLPFADYLEVVEKSVEISTGKKNETATAQI